MSVLVIYHNNCFDGFTAAWVAKQGIRDDKEFYGATYGEEPPNVTGRNVYIVDFSYPREKLLKMKEQADSLLVLDHHKTAQADLEGLDFCQFDMNRSGAGLAWDFWFDTQEWPRPPIVNIVEDRDLWRFKLPETERAMAYIATKPFTFEAWDELGAMEVADVVSKGESILDYIKQYGQKAIEHAQLRDVGGYEVPVMNVSYQNCSEHVNALCKTFPNRSFAASFFLRKDNKWQFSLRSIGDFDVSAVAKAFGGGGHKNAAGFELPYEKIWRFPGDTLGSQASA